MAIVIAAAMGTLMILLVIYACIVASSRMDDQLQDLQQRKLEEQKENGRGKDNEE